MTAPPSLTLRIVGYLLIAQLIGFTVAWALTTGLAVTGVWPNNDTLLDDLATPRIQKLVIASLRRADDGALRIERSESLLAEIERTPSLRIAAFDSGSGKALAGSSPDLVTALAEHGQIKLSQANFESVADSAAHLHGFISRQNTPYGRMQIAVHGYRFRWHDLLNYFYAVDLEWLPIFFIAAFSTSAASAWFAVRRGLAPLRASANEAKLIDMNSLDHRICEDGVPGEVMPFVEAVNGALARVDAGAARQRRFVANAAHELRTPTAILRARLSHFDEPEFLNNLEYDARRIQNIVEQLLATARIGAHRDELEQEINLVEIVRSVVDNRALLALKNARELDLTEQKKVILMRGDRRALESVIGNLIDNALRAEPEGGTVLVRVSSDSTVEVSDHGAGVEETDRELIFEPFWRKNDATPGTGLGLAIAKELIDKHNGRIWVEETPGGGATFKISLSQATA